MTDWPAPSVWFTKYADRRRTTVDRRKSSVDGRPSLVSQKKRDTMTMKKHQPFALILAGALMLSLASVVVAQEQTETGHKNWHQRSQASNEQQAGTGEDHQRAFPHGPGFNLRSSQMRFGDKTVAGAPFSAQVEMESTRTLADGTRSTHKGTGMLYRDSEGRTRHEMSLGVLGPFASAGDPPQMVFINDPVGGA